MHNSLVFTYDSVEALTLNEDCNYILNVPMFYEFDNYSNDRVDFVFDTGAYITVITKRDAAFLGFTNSYIIQSGVPLSGFIGGCMVDIMNIPGMIIGGRHLEGVKVAVPQVDTDTNILGLNVLETFKYLIDTENDLIFFAQNPLPNIPELLRCGKIRSISYGAKNGVK